jgi:histidyl-tRNA synthetase
MQETTPMKSVNKKTSIPSYVKTASFYGFLSAPDYIEQFEVSKADLLKAKSVLAKNPASAIAEKISLVRLFIEKKMVELPQPTMIYYKGHMQEHSTFNLDIIGNSKSIADAILIETSYVIAKEEYGDCNVSVELNTIGDKESLTRLQRELGTFYKKNSSKIPKELKALYKKNIFESFKTENPKAVELRSMGPDSFKGLSEQSRQHFKEVLEYIENLAIPYTIHPYLLGDLSFATETVFQVVAVHKKTKERKVVAFGQRYNGIAKKFFGKRDIPSIGVSISVKKEKFECVGKGKTHVPKFFFIQLSFDAKLQSLQVLETLRKAHTDVYQSLSKDKMSAQIALAEKMNIPYVIIMGKKEAMEKSVLVRNMNTRCQDTVMLADLIDYVKKLK